jgi:hypothetical protein
MLLSTVELGYNELDWNLGITGVRYDLLMLLPTTKLFFLIKKNRVYLFIGVQAIKKYAINDF